jgi:hypothetical protein
MGHESEVVKALIGFGEGEDVASSSGGETVEEDVLWKVEDSECRQLRSVM